MSRKYYMDKLKYELGLSVPFMIQFDKNIPVEKQLEFVSKKYKKYHHSYESHHSIFYVITPPGSLPSRAICYNFTRYSEESPFIKYIEWRYTKNMNTGYRTYSPKDISFVMFDRN